jgi:hypothetical protein
VALLGKKAIEPKPLTTPSLYEVWATINEMKKLSWKSSSRERIMKNIIP